jgi:hypothetical protein
MTGGSLSVLAAVQLVLTAMPGVAAALLGVRMGVRSEPVLLGIALATSGVAAILTFWVYYLAPYLGALCAYAVFFGSIGVVASSWRYVTQHRDLLRRLSIPLGLWALGSLFMVFFGFLYGGTEMAVEIAYSRFSTQPTLATSDNSIPLFFSDWMYAGHPGSPPIFPPDWLFSDRPPLQVGYVLTQRVFGWDSTTLHYQLLGIMLEQLWIVGMWSLLVAARVTRMTRGLIMVALLVSDVAIFNSFYVWPKLLGTAFALGGLALVANQRVSMLRERPWTIALLSALAALSFLSHGTAVFALIPIVVVAVWRGLPSWRWLAAGGALFLVLVVPWTAYQHYRDPPGDRLLKWHLAGAVPIDDRGVFETISDEYGKVGFEGAIKNKFENFRTMAGGNPGPGSPKPGESSYGDVFAEIGDMFQALGEGRFGIANSKVREIRRWHMLWTTGLLMLAVPLIAFGWSRRRPRSKEDWRFALLCLAVFAIGTAFWGLLIFGNVPARTVVATGSLALPLVAIAGLVAGLRATYPSWAGWLVTANVVTVLLLYSPNLEDPGEDPSGFAALAAVGALVCFLALAFSSRAGWGYGRANVGPGSSGFQAAALPMEE